MLGAGLSVPEVSARKPGVDVEIPSAGDGLVFRSGDALVLRSGDRLILREQA